MLAAVLLRSAEVLSRPIHVAAMEVEYEKSSRVENSDLVIDAAALRLK